MAIEMQKKGYQNCFTYVFDQNAVDTDLLLKQLKSSSSLLNNLYENQKWKVSFSKGSTRMDIFAESPENIDIELLNNAIDHFSTSDTPVLNVNEEAIRAIQQLATNAGEKDYLILQNKKKNFTPDIQKNTKSLIDKMNDIYESYGSVEGILKQLTLKNNEYELVIKRRLEGMDDVKCMFNEEMLEEAKHLFGDRIEVYGLITYKGGIPQKLKVQKIYTFDRDEDLPNFEDIWGIWRGYT